MNSEIVWTAVGLLVAGLFILPFYVGLAVALYRAKMKADLEFYTQMHIIEKDLHIDSSIERLFEEGGR